MPIRLCQKCGLKVLIDESQAGTNPFYCQRCTTAMKGQENAPAPGPITPVRNLTPSPVSMAGRSDPVAPSVGAAKAATVRVLCPYCKASFNGRVPQKPARGSCPVCQKELILLPNGDIKPAAGFDLGTYQGEPAASKDSEPASEPEAPKESGTRMLVKKYAAEPAKVEPSRPAARNVPAAETDVSEEVGALPGWLDDSAGGAPVKPQPDTDVEIDVVSPKGDDLEDRTIRQEEPPPPPPPPAHRARGPIVAKMPTMSSGKPPAAVAPPPLPPEPEVDLLPEPAPSPSLRKPTGRVPSGERRAPAPQPVLAEPGETGMGKVLFAIVLALLPVAACGGLLTQKDQLKNDMVKKLGTRLVAGFAKLDQKLFPPPPPPKPVEEKKVEPPPPPPPEEPPKADPEQQKKDEQKISHLNDEVNTLQFSLKKAGVAASPEQQKSNEEMKKAIEGKREKIRELRSLYQKMYGKDYDPQNQ